MAGLPTALKTPESGAPVDGTAAADAGPAAAGAAVAGGAAVSAAGASAGCLRAGGKQGRAGSETNQVGGSHDGNPLCRCHGSGAAR